MLNIREHRIRMGKTQAELARDVHIAQSAVAAWESGAKNPRTEMLPALAAALHCEIGELFEKPTQSA